MEARGLRDTAAWGAQGPRGTRAWRRGERGRRSVGAWGTGDRSPGARGYGQRGARENGGLRAPGDMGRETWVKGHGGTAGQRIRSARRLFYWSRVKGVGGADPANIRIVLKRDGNLPSCYF